MRQLCRLLDLPTFGPIRRGGTIVRQFACEQSEKELQHAFCIMGVWHHEHHHILYYIHIGFVPPSAPARGLR